MLNNNRFPKKSGHSNLQKRSRTSNGDEKDYELKQNYQYQDDAGRYFANVSGSSPMKQQKVAESQQPQFQQMPAMMPQ